MLMFSGKEKDAGVNIRGVNPYNPKIELEISVWTHNELVHLKKVFRGSVHGTGLESMSNPVVMPIL